MEHFYIIANSHKDCNMEKSNYIKQYLEAGGKCCTLQACSYGQEQAFTDPGCIPPDVDCILVLGGDGTLLQAARDIIHRDIPLLGINLGTLGYLAEVEEQGLNAALDQLIAGIYEVEKRMMLTGKVVRGGYHRKRHQENGIDSTQDDSYALNDIAVTRSGSLQVIRFQLWVNGQFLNRYSADGVIIATPTGSTGYNLSAGGPIVEPGAELMVVTPVCPHTLNTRSIILAPGDLIEIEIPSGRDESIQQVEVNFDGSHRLDLFTGDRVEIRKAEKTTDIVKLNKVSFLEVLHKKLSE